MTIALFPVQTQADRRAFYRFAFRVYRDDPVWAPPLWLQRKNYLEKKAAFFTYGEGDFWLAKEGQEIVGTLGVAIDHSRNCAMGWNAALFGFFEVLPGRYDAAQAMWDFACSWARQRGMTELIGPYSFSSNDEQGFLVAGFDQPLSVMLGHNPPYYPEFAERYGFRKSELGDWVAYRYDFSQINYNPENAPPILTKIACRARQRHGENIIRTPKMKDWDVEVEHLHAIYNTSLSVLPEFSPLELSEFRAQAQGLKEIIDPDLVLIAEVDGKAVGFALGLPNIAEALQFANGLQYPWDYLRLLRVRKQITSASFKILAVDPRYWGYGLEAVMILEMGKRMLRKGYRWVDASVTSEFNPQTNKLAARFGAYVYRRYREFRLLL